MSTRPRPVPCTSLKRRGSRTAGQARMCRWAPHTGAWAPPRTCAAPNLLRRTCGPRSCVSKAQNSHLPEFEAARQPHGRPSALVPPGASAVGRGRRPECARLQTRSGWHAVCAAVLTRPRTVTCPSLARRDSPTAARARLCRWAPLTGAWAPPNMCAAPNSRRLACGPCICVNKAQNSHLPEFGAARQPHGRPGALVPLGASATERRRHAAVRGPKLVPAGMRPVQLCQQGLEQSHA